MKIKKIKPECPVCGKKMIIKEIHCPDCDITVTGNMTVQGDMPLSDKDWQFVHDFIMCEGNLKCLGEKMNLSYPTLKNILQEVKEKLPGYKAVIKEEVDSVLGELESGNIDINDAIEKLKRRK